MKKLVTAGALILLGLAVLSACGKMIRHLAALLLKVLKRPLQTKL